MALKSGLKLLNICLGGLANNAERDGIIIWTQTLRRLLGLMKKSGCYSYIIGRLVTNGQRLQRCSKEELITLSRIIGTPQWRKSYQSWTPYSNYIWKRFWLRKASHKQDWAFRWTLPKGSSLKKLKKTSSKKSLVY